jgi:hypothetical protein
MPTAAARPPLSERHSRYRYVQALLALLLLLWAPFSHAVVVHAPPPKVFCLTGRVVAPWTGGTPQPIPATLALAVFSDRDVAAPLHVVTANETGSFSFPSVPRGRYWLRVSCTGFFTLTTQVHVVRYSLRPRSSLLVTLYISEVGVNPSTIATERPISSGKTP